jgi:hypothetical protein
VITANTVNRILRFNGRGLPVVSLYAPVPYQPQGRVVSLRSEVVSQLHVVRPMARDHSHGHDARMSIRGDIDRIMDAAGQERWPPGAVALFSCSGRGFFEEVILPRQVRERVIVDETTWVRPMLAVLGEYHRCCVAAVDREGTVNFRSCGRSANHISLISHTRPGECGGGTGESRPRIAQVDSAPQEALDRDPTGGFAPSVPDAEDGSPAG